MSLSNTEFAAILGHAKRIVGDIHWDGDEDRSPSQVFRAEVESEEGWPLFIQGRYNRLAGSLTFALILRTEGRIYGLDMGKDHHNPQCDQVGEEHKHAWNEQYRDKEAYAPSDLIAPVHNPVAVWEQFCQEACIEHAGVMNRPPPEQTGMF